MVSSGIFIIIGFANIMGWSFAIDNVPQAISNAILSVSDNPNVIILMMLAILVFIGAFMEATACMMLLAPILLPIAISIGMDPVHFGLIVCIMLTIALITPPVGMTIFVTSNITGVSVERLFAAVIPMALVAIVLTGILAFLPDVCLFIPRL